MLVYLSSYRLGTSAEALRRAGGRALIVMNALDEYDDRLLNWDREADDLAGLGYRSEELDLRDYWHGSNALGDRLAAADLLWVVGGNVFVLARAATAAGLGDAIRQSPALAYAGYSAGACLASIDLSGLDEMDDPSTLPDGYSSDMRIESLALSGLRIVPHAGSPEAEAAALALRKRGLEFVELRDGDDLVLDGRTSS